MMSSGTESLALGTHAQWSEQAIHIRDFTTKYPLPNIVKVIKGQYRNIGVSKSVCNELYLHNVMTVSKVLAESVKMKEGKSKVVVSDQKYSLPVTYKGWFELLSQDGKAIKAIQSVQELTRFFPSSCLVRENMKGFVHRGAGELSLDRTRTVHAGEVLSLIGEMWVPFPIGKVMAKRRILKCVDDKGEEIFFGLEQKGTFSPIAGQNNISGVHSIKGLLEKFRLPLMVRLVHGVIPTKMEKGFSGVFRFVNVYSDENAFVCPLKKETRMVPISTREALKVVTAHNFDSLASVDECVMIKKKCTEMLESYMNSIHILVTMPDSSILLKGKKELQTAGELNHNTEIGTDIPGKSPNSISEDEEDLLFQEIDGIYQYVREGGLPPAPKVRKSKAPLPPTDVPGSSQPKHPTHLLTSMQSLQSDDPNMEIKMKQLDLPEEEDEADTNHYRSTLPKRDSYTWEEPIYEPLDKIREQKKRLEAQKSQDLTVTSGFDSPPRTEFSEDAKKSPSNSRKNSTGESQPTPTEGLAPQTAGMAGSMPVSSALSGSTPVSLGTPVSSLRQVMKGTNHEGPRPKSLSMDSHTALDTNQQVYRKFPPPVPPKRYVSEDSPFPENPTKQGTEIGNSFLKNTKSTKSAQLASNGAPKGLYVGAGQTRQRVANAQVSVTSGSLANTYNTSSSSGSSNSMQPSDKKLHHSVSSPAAPTHRHSIATPHPPYVAVARVGDYQQGHGPTSTVLVNPGMYNKRSNSVDQSHSSQKVLHSMYL